MDEDLKNYFLEAIEHSKFEKSPLVKNLAANAVSVLVSIGFDFSDHDFSGVSI